MFHPVGCPGFDDAFRITSTTNSSGGPSWTLGYDLLDRLNSATKSGTTIGYTYDANGNRLTQTGTSASTYTVASTSNRLSSTSGALARSYTYNASGSALTSGATTHTYYNSGRMKTAKLGSASVTTYLHNALGQRVKKSGGAISTAVYFMYDEAGHLVGEYNWVSNALVLVQETVWLGDIPIATLRGTSVFYAHTDQLNTPRKVTSNAATPVLRWKWDPSPFGDGGGLNENPGGVGAFKYHLRFPGQYLDVESNLNYNYFRDYDPAIGRYVESDPLGLIAGINTYTYVSGNPVELVDPLGQQEFDPGQAGANPFPRRRGPAGGSRDRRTPWLPNHLAHRGLCAPYWNVTWYNGGDVERRSLVPLISERKILETDCVIGVECKYKGWIIPSLDWSDRPRAQHFPFSTTYYKEVPKNGGGCGCQRD